MPEDTLDIIAKLAANAAQQRGLRSDCQGIVDTVQREMKSLFSFIFLERAEHNDNELIAAAGLEPTEFRRLDERLNRTALLRCLDISEPTRLLINDEPTLEFLSRPGVAGEIVCVPVMSTSHAIGVLATAYDKRKARPSGETLKVLEIASTLVNGLVNSGSSRESEARKLAEENISLKQELRRRNDLSSLIGNSASMRSVHAKVAQIARSNAAVLIRGEGGTGKELIANAIHHNSLRARSALVKVNCSGLSDTTIDGEIFGDLSSGSERRGKLEEAEGGTLWLDEVAGLGQQTQVRLLRLLRDKEYEPVGSSETRRANVRFLAASSQPLEDLVDDGLFRGDLFFKLNVFTINLPPLRERKADILLLADHFLRRYAREYDKNILRISTPAIDMLTAYHFPGNVRELENAIESAVLTTKEGVIHSHHLPPSLQTAEQSGTEGRRTLESAVKAFERDLIQDALKSTRGNVAKAALMLESTERILGYKIKKYAIDPKRFK